VLVDEFDWVGDPSGILLLGQLEGSCARMLKHNIE
jgi:hypothetical protein